ncbi:MAG: hypothetical protein ABIC91_06700 [Nanoarchaeota archaeon]|nr:Ig domain-containing protein [Nanoarchaeota archaeon]MBU1029683.1 Ig domain-containing protein [Nanoarchaeota archaeon]MBU1849934.1 Ig domain-containing protein [Nanoarchaeota archaeon]
MIVIILSTSFSYAFIPCPDELRNVNRVKEDLKQMIISYFKNPLSTSYTIDEILDVNSFYEDLKKNANEVDCGQIKSSGKDIISIYEDKIRPGCFNGKRDKGELGIDCGGIICTPCPSCTDGTKNQGETSIDCGGPCRACPTCDDNIKNQGEIGIDCGGPCDPCTSNPSCSDGIQNQGETGIDCGGPCTSCDIIIPACNDNIQNGDETGVDCGGSCPKICDEKTDINNAPVITPIENKYVDAGDVISFQIKAYDPEGMQVSFSAENMPLRSILTPVGVFNWQPIPEQVGEYEITFIVSDRVLQSGITMKIIVVNPVYCKDGTASNHCSQSFVFGAPWFCDLQGKLVRKASICGCPEGFVAFQNDCTSAAYIEIRGDVSQDSEKFIINVKNDQ